MDSADAEEVNSTPERPRLPTAKWGAACTACATAKAKCIRSNEEPGAKCDRCQRLFKDCAVQVHRPRKKRQVKPSRTAQIEERLNGLVNLLQASGELPGGAQALRDATHDSTESENATPNKHTPSSTVTSTQPPQAQWHISENYNAYAPPACICRPEIGEAPPPPDSDEVLLDLYRRELQLVHPFVIIPDHVTAAQLHETRPFLMSAIRMVTSFRSLRSMRAQMYYLMEYIADHMLIRSEKSIDLLLGIIVTIGWYQYHCFMHAQLNNLIALAVTLVGEIGLSRHPSVPERISLMVVKPPEPKSRTNEERRAFAGVWFLSSAMSLMFNKSDPMKYTYYLQECIKHLEADMEYESDTRLVFLIRIQHLTERIADLNCKDKATEEVSGIPTAPTSAYISAFQNEITRLRNNLPPNLQNNRVFQIYLNSATLRLYEPPIVDTALISSISESLTSNAIGMGTPLDQIYQSSSALTAWFDNWLAMPVTEYYYQTTPIASQIVYALTMLGRWAKLATPRTMYQGETPMPADMSADNPNVAAYHRDRPAEKALDSNAVMPAGFENRPMSQISMDPNLPAAVAALRAQLQTQPGLTVNIPEILNAICARFEQANATFQIASTESGKVDHNVWSMTALKVRITRAKLERWAELVSAGAQALSLDGKGDNATDTTMEEWRGAYSQQQQQPGAAGSAPGFDASGNFLGGNLQTDMNMEDFPGSTPWTSDLLTGVDPTVWFDGYLDWGAVIMNSMGTVEQ